MKKIALLLLSITLSGLANFMYADYPIVSHRYLADPGALWYNGRLYVYCSNDDENTTENYDMSTIVCVSTTDLKNWTDHGVVFNTDDVSWTNLSWAPSPVYRDGKFYLYYGNGGSAIGVAVSESPIGPFRDPVGRSIVSGSTAGVQPFDGWLFDPMTFVDDDGQAYMYFGGNGDNNLRVIRLNDDMISVNGSAGKFTVPNFFEAAWLHKYNGTYYFSYSTNPDAQMRIDYMTSSNPMSGFTYGGVISSQPPNNNNNNHQAIVQIGDDWYQVYHNRIIAIQNNDLPAYHRNLAIDAFTHNSNGGIDRMANTVDGVQQLKYLDPYVRVEAETMSDQSGIETEVCSEGGMNLAYLDNNDWVMIEGVDFGSSGAGSFMASVASESAGGTMEIRLGGTTGTLIGTMNVPNTGGYQTWRSETISVNQTTGVHNVYLVFKGSGSSVFNVDYWQFFSSGPIVSITSPLSSAEIFAGDEITISANAEAQEGTISQVEFFVDGVSVGVDNTSPYSISYTIETEGEHTISVVATDSQNEEGTVEVVIDVNVPQGPYGGTPHAIPGTIEFEDFDVGGNGFAYFDEDAGTNVDPAPNFRTDEDVDIETCTDDGGGYNLGWTAAGEWLEYTVNVASAGTYNIVIRASCDGNDRTISLSSDGTPVASNIIIPNTAGWQEWVDVLIEDVELQAGEQVLRLTIGETDYVNLNKMSFSLMGGMSISIDNPADGSEFNASQSVVIEATTVVTGGATVAEVSFYANNELIASDNSEPYSATWSGMAEGNYTIKAIATDNSGGTAEDAISIVIGAAPRIFPMRAGWNLIGYPFTESAPLEQALSSIMENVVIVKDTEGFFDATRPASLNSLSELQYGKGYLIYVNEDCELTW